MSMTISGSTNINVPAAAKQAGRQQKTQSGFAGQVLKCVQAGGQKVLLCQDALMSYASPQTGESVNIYRSKNYSADNPVYLLKGLDKDGREFEQEIQMLEDKYKEITGMELAKYYRPPQGKYSAETLKHAKAMGYQTFFWSLAYVDWLEDDQPTKEEAFEKLLGRIHPGAIVLLHSTSATNGQILDELLTEWEKMGYRIRPLSEIR